MKTTADAVNNFRTYWPFSNERTLLMHGTTNYYMDNERQYAPEELVCTLEEFNQCVTEMETNYGKSMPYTQYKSEFNSSDKVIQPPIYTQDMADAGESPGVGMACLNYSKAVIKYMGDLVIYAYVKDGERCDSRHKLKFKPLTPPIELIDGNAYQFSFDTGSDLVLDNVYGIYDSAKVGCMWVKGNAYYMSRCTNIKLLEVK